MITYNQSTTNYLNTGWDTLCLILMQLIFQYRRPASNFEQDFVRKNLQKINTGPLLSNDN